MKLCNSSFGFFLPKSPSLLVSIAFRFFAIVLPLFKGSALGGRGPQDLGLCTQRPPSLQPPPLRRALRRLGGGCLIPKAGDAGCTPRTRWYCPPPQVMEQTLRVKGG